MAMTIEEATAKVIKEAVGRTDEGFKGELYGTKPHVRSVTILTANNPFSNEGTPAWLNNSRNDALEALLKDSGFIFKKVLGKYGNLEHTFSVVNMSLEIARDYAARFCQTSFLQGERKDTNDGRKMNLVYRSFALPQDVNDALREEWGLMNAKSLGFSVDGSKVVIPQNVQPFVDQIKYPHVDGNLYVTDEELDTTDELAYQADAEDYFTRKNGFKFSLPFKRYMESVITEAEDAYAIAKQKLGKRFDYLYGDHFRNDVSGWKGRRQLMHYINEK